jgi:hypothetical protein
LIEKNIIERIGSLNVERIWECAGLKLHTCEGVVIRGNVFREIRNASGLWLDFLIRNCRITGNVFTDIESVQGGLYLECSHAQNLVDNNLFWDMRTVTWPLTGEERGGHGVNVDTGEEAVVAHNFFGKIVGYALNFNLDQADRVVGGRVGLGRKHAALNNIMTQCEKRSYFARAEDNRADGNLFDDGRDALAYCIRYPDPQARLNLEAWQRYYGLDLHSTCATIEAEYDDETGLLTWKIAEPQPGTQPVPMLHQQTAGPPGPFTPEEWERGEGRKQFPGTAR